MAIDDYTVHVGDNEEAVRKSMAFLLTTAGFTVRVYESATGFLAIAPTIRNGCHLRIPSIVITGHGDVPMAVEAMKAGALDLFEKPFEGELLIAAVKHAALQLSDIRDDQEDVEAIHLRLIELTDRERQVLSSVVEGLANKTIAYDLNISPRTVEVHRANVMSKMKAKGLPELVRLALAAKLDIH
jgi:two-component system response regulator FixJ